MAADLSAEQLRSLRAWLETEGSIVRSRVIDPNEGEDGAAEDRLSIIPARDLGIASDMAERALAEARKPASDEGDALMSLYSRALDEISNLRRLLAYEAAVLDTHLEYATFPKSRRGVAIASGARMRMTANGHAAAVVSGLSSRSLRSAMDEAGAPETLTRWQWEAELPAAAPASRAGEQRPT